MLFANSRTGEICMWYAISSLALTVTFFSVTVTVTEMLLAVVVVVGCIRTGTNVLYDSLYLYTTVSVS